VLTVHQDLGVRFWAKKVYRKYSFQFFRDEPERFAETAEEGGLPLEILVRMLTSVRTSTFMAMKVLKKICGIGSPAARQVLVNHLKEVRDPFQISFLTKNLGVHFPADDLIPELLPFLSHVDDRVVANTIEGLEAIGSPKTFEIISRFLKHRHNRVRANAAKAVAGFDPRKAHDILQRMLATKGSSHLVISACHAIRELKDPRYLATLQGLLHDEATLGDVVETMLALDRPRALEILAGHLERCERRLDRIRGVLAEAGSDGPGVVSLESLRQGRVAQWLDGLEWEEWVSRRRLVLVTVLLAVGVGLFLAMTGFQTPETRRARAELDRLRLPFTVPVFLRAVSANDAPVLDLFLKAGMGPGVRNEAGAGPLHVAAHAGHGALVDRLLGLGADVGARDEQGLTALHLAATREVAERLVKRGGDPFAVDRRGRTPFHRAAEQGNVELLEFLLGRGADLNGQAGDGNTPLHLAARAHQAAAVRYLVGKGARLDTRNQAGVSPRDLGVSGKAP